MDMARGWRGAVGYIRISPYTTVEKSDQHTPAGIERRDIGDTGYVFANDSEMMTGPGIFNKVGGITGDSTVTVGGEDQAFSPGLNHESSTNQ